MKTLDSGNFRIEIIYEDRDILVCHKPGGIPVQTKQIGVPDLVSILKNYLVSQQSAGQNADLHSPVSAFRQEPYLAVIHRLDQPVEGLLVFAKSRAAARELNRQLTASGFGKYYLALVSGHPCPEENTLTDYLIKDARSNTSRVCSFGTPGAKEACLHYRTLKSFETRSLLEIHLDTGRHHQIRVQLANLGCPIEGDRKYGKESSSGSKTLKLCAYRLEFMHPATGKPMHFELSDCFDL